MVRAQSIHLYCLCWNDSRMLPFFYRHYDKLVDHFFVFDNGSNDGSLEILRAHPRTTVATFETQNNSFGQTEISLSERMWKQSIGRAEWVVIVDIDEHLHHPDLPTYLARCKALGVTAVRATGYEMVSDTFPDTELPLCVVVRNGERSIGYDKLCIFNPNALTATGYGGGRHIAAPEGQVVWEKRREIRLLHFKKLGVDYVIDRHRQLAEGLKDGDVHLGLGMHYRWDPEKTTAEFHAVRSRARPLPDFLEGGLDEFVAAETIAAKGLFDYTYYLARQPDVRAAKVDPLLHFCTHGWREGRKPNHLFDPKWYLTQYPECRRGDLNPLLHYIWRGEQAGHKPGPLFNPTAYREAHRLPPEQSPLSHRLMAVVKRRTAWARGLPAVLPIATVLATKGLDVVG